MSAKIQQVILKELGTETSEDGQWGRMTIEGTQGEIIHVTFPTTDYMTIVGTFLKSALDDLIRAAKAAGSNVEAGHILKSQIRKTEQHSAVRVEVVAAMGGHALLIDTSDRVQLQILLSEASRQALLKFLT